MRGNSLMTLTIGGSVPSAYTGEIAKHAVAAGFVCEGTGPARRPSNDQEASDQIERAFREASENNDTVRLEANEIRQGDRNALATYLDGLKVPFVLEIGHARQTMVADPYQGSLVASRPDVGRNGIESIAASLDGRPLFDDLKLEDISDKPEVSTAKEMIREVRRYGDLFDPNKLPALDVAEPVPGFH